MSHSMERLVMSHSYRLVYRSATNRDTFGGSIVGSTAPRHYVCDSISVTLKGMVKLSNTTNAEAGHALVCGISLAAGGAERVGVFYEVVKAGAPHYSVLIL